MSLHKHCLIFIISDKQTKTMKEDRIGVFVRVRPYQDKELQSTFILGMNDKEMTVKDKQRDKQQDLKFTFDHIFQVKSTQQEVFEKIGQPIVDSAFEGINGTMFAYGQTSSGKTYTCVGPDCEDAQDKGLLPRCVSSIFERISESPNYIEFRIKVSMVEIYMEKIRDLLDPSKLDLKIRQNKAKGIYIQDVTEQYVSSADEAMKVFKKGVSNRVVAFTNMNDLSSRSHMAFILTLHQNNLKDGSAKSGKITVVDLAGSQKVSKTHAEGKVLDEAKQINKSLSCLGNVINALTDPKTNHIPYRDSKLTRLLQESIGGNSKTTLIINISPSSYNASESISSLRFGYRAKEIKNKPKINKEYTIAQLLLLLEKSEKRNQQLQLLLKQFTASNAKRIKSTKSNVYVENLLDSDNPLMSAIEDNEEEVPVNRSALKTIKKCYESEIGSQGQEEGERLKKSESVVSQLKLADHSQEVEQLKSLLADKEDQLRIVSQELIRVNNQRVDFGRQLDICRERLELVLKQAKLNLMKLNAEKRQGQQLLQKFIKKNLDSQEKDSEITRLQLKIQDYQEKFIKLNQIQHQQSKKSNLFGLDKAYNQQTSKIIEEALNENQDNQEARKHMEEAIQLQKSNQQMKNRIKDLQQELKIYQNLEKVKEDLIQQKLAFIQERDRVYRDLENRIEKVLELEEKLDEQQQRRKSLEEIVNMQESQKGRKIVSLQKHIHQISQNYYVLKGQQSSWLKNNKKIEQTSQQSRQKINDQLKKIIHLEGENLELRAEVENLQMRVEEFQTLNQSQSVLEVEIQDEESERGNGNIVKVVRSDIFGKY